MMALHVSEQDAARDFLGLLARVRAGQQIVIESESMPIAILQPTADAAAPKLLSESLALAERHAAERGYEPVTDEGFAKDMERIVGLRGTRPRRAPTEWD